MIVEDGGMSAIDHTRGQWLDLSSRAVDHHCHLVEVHQVDVLWLACVV